MHSAERLIGMLASRPLSAERIIREFKTILVCPPHAVLNLSQRCGWVQARSDGLLEPSVRGAQLLSASNYESRLREQLRDYVMIEKPAWARLLPRGRAEMSRFVPRDVAQVFREAGVMQAPPSDDVVGWWDEMARIARGAADVVSTEIGRTGERLTIERERTRTGREPLWMAIESNLSGFDVMSVVTAECHDPLRIEVKASMESLEHAQFHVRRNEWMAAVTGTAYRFHLWCLRDGHDPCLAELSPEAVEFHIPGDRGEGKWEGNAIPYRVFREHFENVS